VRIDCRCVEDVPGGTIFEIREAEDRPNRETATHSDGDRVATLEKCRRARTRVLVVGESGSGRTTLLEELADGVDVIRFDVAEMDEPDQHRLIAELRAGVRAHDGLVVIEGIHLLVPRVAERLARFVAGADSWVALSSCPVSELGREQAALAACCMARVEARALRHRREELPSLVRRMIASIEPDSEVELETGLWEALMSQDWPGNLRELRTVMESALQHRHGNYVAVDDLPAAYQTGRGWRRLSQLEQVEYDAIVRTLESCGGNKVKAAKLLGIGRTTLYNRMRALGVRG
jgi:hypothetical protein